MNPIGWPSQPDPLLSSAALTRAAVMQRQEPLTSAGFLAAQFHELWSRPAAVRVGRRSTPSGHRPARSTAANQSPAQLWLEPWRCQVNFPCASAFGKMQAEGELYASYA